MTGSPNNNLSRLNEFLAAAKGESASLAAQKAKSKPLHPFSIRLTQEERERLEAEAKGKPLSVYMRERLLGDGSAPRKLRRKPAADQAGLAKVLGMLGQSRLANNLNQIAKAAHIGVLVVSPALIEELENACRDIRIMRDALLSALGFPPAGVRPMILVGNQRGGGRDLAAHLLSGENDHVTVHEVRGFASDDVQGAFQEAHALSLGTRCKQFLFSLSFNPPPRENVSAEAFEDAIARAEAKLGLTNQPRVIVFHEKEGRRHAHAVWSRIDIEEMKAVPLSYSHRKLQDLSRELYLEHGWKMPDGLADRSRSDPRNFTLDEWQHAKRQGQDPRAIKAALQDAWAVSDNKAALVHALKERGYSLARGDRRGYVAVDHKGEVYALPKWAGVKTKDVRARLGEADTLPSLDEAKATFAKEMQPALSRWERELQERIDAQHARYEAHKHGLLERQTVERQKLFDGIEDRRIKETQARQERFRTGLAGFWDKLRGEHRRLREENEKDAYDALLRDRRQKDDLIFAQLEARRALADRHKQDLERLQDQQRGLAEDRARFERTSQGPPDTPDDRKRAFLENRRNTGNDPERTRAPEPER